MIEQNTKIYNTTTIESLVERTEIKEILERLELKGLRLCKHLMLKSEDLLDLLNSLPPHVILQVIADEMKKAEIETLKQQTSELKLLKNIDIKKVE